MSSSLYATLPDTSETSFAREMTAMQSEVNAHSGHVTLQEMHGCLYCSSKASLIRCCDPNLLYLLLLLLHLQGKQQLEEHLCCWSWVVLGGSGWFWMSSR